MGPAVLSMVTIALLSVFTVTGATVAPTPTATPLDCLNDGISDQVKCICPNFTEGTRCESIKDRIELGKKFEATMEVVLTINYAYSSDLTNISSPGYKEFMKRYNDMMRRLLQGHDGRYNFTKLVDSSGEVTVENYVILKIQYNETLDVSKQYEKIYNDIVAALKNNTCKSRSLCIRSYTTKAIRPLTEKERCGIIVSPVFVGLFHPVISKDGLACVSTCEPASPKFVNCTIGNCQIRGEEGARCFCPNTEKYLYTYPRCQGRVLIVAMYGGVGASIGLLVIIGVVLGVFLYLKKYKH